MPDITSDDIDSIADKLDDVEDLIDQDADLSTDQDDNLFCLGCGYLGAEEECPECGEKMAHIPSEGGYATYPGDDIDEAVSRFASSARAICEHKNYSSNDVASALNHSWSQHTTNIDSKIPAKAVNLLRRLKRAYPGFNPTLTESRSNAMSSDNTFFGSKGMKPSPHLHDQPNDMSEIAGKDPRKRSTKNQIGTPTVGKGSMERAGTVKSGGPKNEGRLKSLNANILKENAEKLAKRIKNALRETAHGIRGRHLVNFTVMVTEGNEKNRTKIRRRLAEAIADVEEVLQFHSVDDVMLEAWFKDSYGAIVMKKDIPLGFVAPRGPIVSEGKAIFRFRRNAEIFSESLGNAGYVCRVMPHNWGAAVSAPVTMETANRAFRSINEAWYDGIRNFFTGGGKKKAPQSSPDALAAEYAGMQQGDATRPGGYSNRRGPANTATQPPYAGQIRKSLNYKISELATKAQSTMAQARKMISQLQESMRRRRNLVEWSKTDDLGSALDDLETRYTSGGATSSLGQSDVKGLGRNLLNQLSKVLMPDEIGYDQKHENALTTILYNAAMQVEQTYKKLMQFYQQTRSVTKQVDGLNNTLGRRINRRSMNPGNKVASDYGIATKSDDSFVKAMTGKSQRNASFESRRRYRSTINESVETLQSLLQRYEQSVSKLQELVGQVQQRVQERGMVRSNIAADYNSDARANARQLAPSNRMKNTTATRRSTDDAGRTTSQRNIVAQNPNYGMDDDAPLTFNKR